MAAPSDDWLGQVWSAVWPGVTVVVSGVAGLFAKTFWSSVLSAHSEEAKQEKQDEKERRQLVRNLDTRASAELERAWKRSDELQEEVDAERRSGMDHYHARIRLYDYVVELIHDWRAGKPPPDKVPDFDKI